MNKVWNVSLFSSNFMATQVFIRRGHETYLIKTSKNNTIASTGSMCGICVSFAGFRFRVINTEQ